MYLWINKTSNFKHKHKHKHEHKHKIKMAMSHSTWKMDSSSDKRISTQKFESPGFQIEHKINWKVDAPSRGIQ